MIRKYTNVLGFSRYALIVRASGSGVYVIQDEFESRGPDSRYVSPAGYAWIDNEPSPYVSAQPVVTLLPVETPLAWRHPLIREAHQAMRAGAFAAWWAAHEPTIRQDLARNL